MFLYFVSVIVGFLLSHMRGNKGIVPYIHAIFGPVYSIYAILMMNNNIR